MNDHEHSGPTTVLDDLDDRIEIEVLISKDREEKELERLRSLLLQPIPRIPSRYFYDDRGSLLFEQITELDEYYQTRTERSLLERHADEIVAQTDAEELVEVGSGAASKTRVLLDAMRRRGCLELYVPLDVSEGIVRRSARELVSEYPQLRVHAIVGNFLEHLDAIPDGCPRVIAFLGGTIGNFEPHPEAVDLLSRLRHVMCDEDTLLLGTDLIKDPSIIELAYNDRAGVTAEFNLNILRVVNRRFDADFDPADFEHRAIYDRENRWIEMRLVATRPVEARVEAVDVDVRLAPGEYLLTELSVKYDQERIDRVFAAAGLERLHWYQDDRGLFALSLARAVG